MGKLTKSGLNTLRGYRDLERMIDPEDLLRIIWIDFLAAIPEGIPGKWTLHIYERGDSQHGQFMNGLIEFPVPTETVNQIANREPIREWTIPAYSMTSFSNGDAQTTLVTGPFSVALRQELDPYRQPVLLLALSQNGQLAFESPIAHVPLWLDYVRKIVPVWAQRPSIPREKLAHALVNDTYHVIVQLERAGVPEDDPEKTQETLIFANSVGVLQWALAPQPPEQERRDRRAIASPRSWIKRAK